MNYNGERFLDILYKDLYKSDDVLHTKNKNDTKEESIATYLNRLERIHNKADSKNKKDLIKKLYYDKYIIKKENMPNYIDTYRKDEIIDEQKRTLSTWIDYLSDENVMYPVWAKYWVFRQMLKMGTYDELVGNYTKRDKTTRNPFVEANPEIIAKCIDNITKLLGNEKKSSQEIRKLVSNVSFEKMYIKYQQSYKEQYKTNEGIWVKYNQGNNADAKKLADSLEGYNTKWCTAGESTAKHQLSKGDFYVYYTKNKDANYVVPRIAIRLRGSNFIMEIRGVEGFQDLEDDMIPVLESKLKEMTFLSQDNVDGYMEKIKNLQELKKIKEKTRNNIELTQKEIYDLYSKKFGFGYGNPPEEKLVKKRKFQDDYEKIKNLDLESKVKFISTASFKFNHKNLDFILDERDVLLKLVKIAGYYLDFATDKLKNDKEIVSEAIKTSGVDMIQFASFEIKKDKDFILYILKKEMQSYILYYINKDLCDDEEFMLDAISIDENSIDYVSDRLRYNKKFIIKALKTNPNLLKVARDKRISATYLKNIEVVESAIKKDPKYIKYADYELQVNKKFLLKNLKVYPKSFRYLPEELMKNRKFVLKGIKKNPYAGLYYMVRRLDYFLVEATKKL